jgi:hypothetical protein
MDTPKRCTTHDHHDRNAVMNLDGDDLCQECANNWVRAEGDWQHYLDSETAAFADQPGYD